MRIIKLPRIHMFKGPSKYSLMGCKAALEEDREEAREGGRSELGGVKGGAELETGKGGEVRGEGRGRK